MSAGNGDVKADANEFVPLQANSQAHNRPVESPPTGLFAPSMWRDRSGPLIIAHDRRNVMALIAARMAVVGFADSAAGIEPLLKLLADLPANRKIIVLGSNDGPTRGGWPGRDGAKELAEMLALQLHRAVRWALPPVGSRDAREYLLDLRQDGEELAERGQELLKLLLATAQIVRPPVQDNRPVIRITTEEYEVVEHAIAALAAADDGLYQRSGSLVRVIDAESTGQAARTT
jgi:hypothetical protein